MVLDSHPSIFPVLFDSTLVDSFLCLRLFCRLLGELHRTESKETGIRRKISDIGIMERVDR